MELCKYYFYNPGFRIFKNHSLPVLDNKTAVNARLEKNDDRLSYIMHTYGKWNFNLIERFQFKSHRWTSVPKGQHYIWEHPFSARSYLFIFSLWNQHLKKDKLESVFKYTICKWHWHGHPQQLSHEEDTLVNNSRLITVKMHHQMYFIMLYGCHLLTFIYHFLVVGQWNAGFEIKLAMIHVSAVSVLH